MKMPLASQSAVDQRNKSITTERLINVYAAPSDTSGQFELRHVPPTRDFVTLPGGPFFRAMRAVEGVLYAVSNGTLYKVAGNGVASELAAITDDLNTAMAGHRANVTIASGGGYYVWDGTAITQPGGRIVEVGSVAFLNQYTILGERDGREVEWTEVADPLTRNGLQFATAEARDDKNIRIVDNGDYFGVFKQLSAELWASTGLGLYDAFARVQGAVSETGLKSFNLITKTAGQVFFIGDDNIAYLTDGANMTEVSSSAVNTCLSENEPTHCFYYEDRAHAFCVIRFADRPAWQYDMKTGLWHERSSGTNHGPWNVIAAEYCYGHWHLADLLGRIYRIGDEPFDADGPMRRTIVCRELSFDGANFTVWEFELLGRFGRHSITEMGPNYILGQDNLPILGQDGNPLIGEGTTGQLIVRPARLWIRVSDDGGNTFGLPKHRDVAKKGQYKAKCKFYSMGDFDKFSVEINITDPVDMPLLAEANVKVLA